MRNDKDDMKQISLDREDASGICFSHDVTLVDEYGGMATIGLSQVDGPCHTVQQFEMELRNSNAWTESGISSSSWSIGLDDLFDDNSDDDPTRRLNDGASSGIKEREGVSETDDDDDDDEDDDDDDDKNDDADKDDGDFDYLHHDGGRSPEQLARDARMYVGKCTNLCAKTMLKPYRFTHKFDCHFCHYSGIASSVRWPFRRHKRLSEMLEKVP
jgi:hypothetical protein